MRALRTSKTWLFLTLNALLILAGAPAFASQCCCASTSTIAVEAASQSTDASSTEAPCHNEAAPKGVAAPESVSLGKAIVMNCCVSSNVAGVQTSSAQRAAESGALDELALPQLEQLTQVCSCSSFETAAVASDDLRCAHHISHFVTTLPTSSAPHLQAARFSFSAANFFALPAPATARASGRSPPLV